MAIDFPDSPTEGDQYTVNGKTYQWDGTVWGVYGTFSRDFTASDTAPLNVADGHIWYRSDQSQTLIRYDGTWVEVGSAGGFDSSSTSFPSSLDSGTGFAAVEALQAKVGVDSSAVTSSHDYILSNGVLPTLNVDSGVLVVDDTNNRVGINDSTPSYALDVTGDINASGDVRIGGTSLGRGVLDFQESASDFSISTSFSDIMNITFTLASTRRVIIAAAIPLIDLVSGTTTNCSNIFQDTNAAGSPANYYGQFHATTTTHGLGQATYYNVATLTAGTYTVYWVALVNSGTARYNGATGADRRHQLTAIDLGAG